MAFPILGVLGAIGGLLEKVIPDPQKAAEAKIKLTELAAQGELKEIDLLIEQIRLNAIEAAGNWFQRGWRPFVGWTCGLAFAYNFVVLPFMVFIATVMFNVPLAKMPPALDLETMLPVLLGILGLAGARSFERSKGRV